jgi:hypothetical protein
LVNVSQLSAIEKTCFFLNVYHIMVLHGLIDKGIVQGSDLKDKWLQFARGIKYMVGAFNYSIESLEELLRQSSLAGNAGAALAGASRRAGGALMLCMSRMFASSPRVQVFHPSTWDQQLTAACRTVCEGVQVKTSSKTVILPKVFETHRDLFPREPRELIACISLDCAPGVQHALAVSSSFKIKFERDDCRVVYPKQPAAHDGGSAVMREAISSQTFDEQLLQQNMNHLHVQQPVAVSNHRLVQQQHQQHLQHAALEYRGDLNFHPLPTPNFAPPQPPGPSLTSFGSAVLPAPAKCVHCDCGGDNLRCLFLNESECFLMHYF